LPVFRVLWPLPFGDIHQGVFLMEVKIETSSTRSTAVVRWVRRPRLHSSVT